MEQSRPTKLSIIGAGGVGVAIAYAALIRGSADVVALHDLAAAKVEAEVLDLAHAMPFLAAKGIEGGSDLRVIAGSDVVVITAGAKQQPGEPRLALAARNADIVRALVPGIREHAPDAILLIVTNPCDVLTVVAQRESGLDGARVLSSGTVLDTSRLRWRLSELVGVHPRSVHALIVGEHGDSEFPLWSRAKIGPVLVREWREGGELRFPKPELDRIADEVMHAAYRIIEGKGATSSAIGVSTARIVEAILRDERAVLPVSSVLRGELGLRDVALSLPSVLGRGGVERVLEVPMEDAERAALERSAEAIASTLRSLD
ncbi:L-lactate dehydrogenase [Agrococcus sp. Marseille-Q4369]|uniref:L-lactate dehydrogenase n=1 Tax=Agrococcus sp. Marseille-Q4369 TaxID=2810513 RepID=UPI001B8BBA59|nr:L-lactate dehydrogenase [Agrococcus sp. Marseille-Q4369]QUW18541.1 L-lactate dehydrogenase [Agrococcus sp. Marseille-Q4369]